MVTACPVYATETRGASSSYSELPREGLPIPGPDETSPLLRDQRTQRTKENLSERWHSARLSASTFVDRNTGLLLVAASQFFFALMGISVKWLSSLNEPVPTLELIWLRMVMTYIYSVVYMYMRKIPSPLLGPKGVRTLLVLRGFTGFFTLSGMYFSLQYLSLSDATALTFISPILTGFSGAVFLRETLSLKETFAGLCNFFGVILIARPSFLFGSPKGNQSEMVTPGQRMLSVSAALIGVLGATGTYTLLRAIGKRAHTLHSLSFFSSQCVLISTICMIAFKIPPVIPTRILWLVMLLLVGIFGLIAQTLLTMGLQRETASRGTLGVYTSIVFAVVFEFLVFHTRPSTLSIAGTAIIMSSAIYTSLTKKTVIKPASCPTLERPALATSYTGDDPEP
ncbi:hypothetical protein BJV78DRAFT_1364195 [Lactifluus subvellereus]|nr:hypothetical protein BJV78DRAFT_1364195 [Lactifluus subvellereus]